ncbi:MAG: phosphate ABC transporter permease subunit PstC [Actinomycetaceae bacterium]|nr:phosphate ABC transporter permease subunit PstC [Arcanobacterium sp.]MDD7686509.1 phosphate ABC transporter permease subunit PstC [Actinomycetaceae bacterium]MDY5272789.1 phosphate ABC transporter permease subunit PstC [Arcanobacterium sp.]
MDTTLTHRNAAVRAKVIDRISSHLVWICGVSLIAITVTIAAFLVVQGSATFTVFGHSIREFLTSAEFNPSQAPDGTERGQVGAAVYIVGSLYVCGVALAIALPFSLGAAVFLTEIAPRIGDKLFRPAVELFLGIPSVVYGWVGMTVLLRLFKDESKGLTGESVLAASIVLAVMIFPTITTVSADAMRAVPDDYRIGAYGLGSTRWQVIYRVVLPAAKVGIFTGIILGLARAFGEALAVAMVIGKTKAFAATILNGTSTLTTAMTADMQEAAEGSEFKAALWTLALVLFLISMLCILIIHVISRRRSQ